ncbi:hypothetical protein M9Y10_024448 [Tritrichomonas musculus]|uniref:Uncharacterized protein n=1 Tax=Tritrichomonas musculus TaxID=1915356 RepID=A0ABR2HC15_9EUKA
MSADAIEKEIVICPANLAEPIDVQEEEQEKTGETNNQNNTENNSLDVKDSLCEGGRIIPPKFVEKKSINSLSEDERALIIANAKMVRLTAFQR